MDGVSSVGGQGWVCSPPFLEVFHREFELAETVEAAAGREGICSGSRHHAGVLSPPGHEMALCFVNRGPATTPSNVGYLYRGSATYMLQTKGRYVG